MEAAIANNKPEDFVEAVLRTLPSPPSSEALRSVKDLLTKSITLVNNKLIALERETVDLSADASETFTATYPDVQFLEPRGRFTLKIGTSTVVVDGKGGNGSIPISKITHLCLLPSHTSSKKEGEDYLVVMFSEPIKICGKPMNNLLLNLSKAVPKPKAGEPAPEEGSEAAITESRRIGLAFKNATGLKVYLPNPRLFTSTSQQRPFLRCHKGVQEGAIYPLACGMVFVKPLIFIGTDDIASFTAGRGGGSGNTRFVDIQIETTKDVSYEFSNIDREELAALNAYVKGFLETRRKKMDEAAAAAAGESSSSAAGSSAALLQALENEGDDDDDDDDDDDEDYNEDDSSDDDDHDGGGSDGSGSDSDDSDLETQQRGNHSHNDDNDDDDDDQPTTKRRKKAEGGGSRKKMAKGPEKKEKEEDDEDEKEEEDRPAAKRGKAKGSTKTSDTGNSTGRKKAPAATKAEANATKTTAATVDLVPKEDSPRVIVKTEATVVIDGGDDAPVVGKKRALEDLTASPTTTAAAATTAASVTTAAPVTAPVSSSSNSCTDATTTSTTNANAAEVEVPPQTKKVKLETTASTAGAAAHTPTQLKKTNTLFAAWGQPQPKEKPEPVPAAVSASTTAMDVDATAEKTVVVERKGVEIIEV